MRTAVSLFATIAVMVDFLSITVRADGELPEDKVAFFEKHIRPALSKYCYECHSEEGGKTRGGLLLDTREGLLQGGDSGPALDTEDLRKSLFLDAITWADPDYEMPPKEKMPAEVIAHFKEWFEMGAPDPRNREVIVVESKVNIEEGRKHWAFQQPVATSGATIDSLVSAKLEDSSIRAVAPADPGTLLRRIYFDLIGLPPTPDEVGAFISAWKKDSEAAIAAKVDELLARPQYGERWGRHWLDVARYAESTGKDVNVTFPHIWRYRDYVFDSFNEDKPYDEFIREQVAGDLLKVKSDEEWQENLIATGFLSMGTKSLNQPNPRQHLADVADEQIDTMSQAILGLTVSCARCHDHKTDPIPTTDYYALAGILLSTETYYGTVQSAQNKRFTELLELPIADPMNAKNRYSEDDIEGLRRQLQDLITKRREGRGSLSQNVLQRIRRQISDIEFLLKRIGDDGVPLTLAMGVQDMDRPSDTEVLVRGEVEKAAQKVERGFLQVLPNGGPTQIRPGESGRRELADWLTSRDNPLTARVMVNRIWLKLIGEGLVSSPNNWGATGQMPSHPKLLDHLAIQFIDDGWSIKNMIRRIVLSETYQRSSQFDQANYERDPDNRLLWRANPRPMDAETIRDSLLAIGGGIDLERPYSSQISEVGDVRIGRGMNQSDLSTAIRYRSVYLPILRDNLPDVLDLFDFADPSVTKPEREPTNVPSQALYLMNNRLVIAEAAAMAKHLIRDFPDLKSQVGHAFLLAYGRQPDEADMEAAKQFFIRYQPVAQSATEQRSPEGRTGRISESGGRPQGPGGSRQGPGRSRGSRGSDGGGEISNTPTIPTMTAEEQALAVFCQSLMASAEFRLLN